MEDRSGQCRRLALRKQLLVSGRRQLSAKPPTRKMLAVTTANRMRPTPVQTGSATNVIQRLFDKSYTNRDRYWHLGERQRMMQMVGHLIDPVDFPELVQKLRVTIVEAHDH